jgi:HD-GYP domain-containing protein (c-di-GMP phosphodiesterase class II)
MKLRVLTEKLKGLVIANPIYSGNGMIMLNKGAVLTERNIKKLQRLGVIIVYIEDDSCPIELQEILDTKTKLEIMKDIAILFNGISKEKKINVNLCEKIVKRTMENINLSENAFLCSNISFNENKELEIVMHSFEVMIYSLITGINRKFNVKKLNNLGVGALLHDIGKLFSEGEEHAKAGYELTKNNTEISTTSYLCLFQHHEYEDGSGFPQKLTSEKIYEFSKIVCIANDYVNLVNNLGSHLPNEAIETMTARAVFKYDHEIFKNFVKAIYCYPNGLEVRLDNQRVGIVVRQNKDLPTRPIIAVFKDGKPLLLDLTSSENQTIFIKEAIL